MIPKIIHYSWLSSENIEDRFFKRALESWEICKPDYEIIHWGPSCVDKFCSESEFFKRSWEEKNYAFCADYIRFYALYNYGGFYFDCDVIMYEKPDKLLDLKRYIGLERIRYYKEKPYLIEKSTIEIAIMGSEKRDDFIGDVLKEFKDPEVYTKENIIGPDLACKIILKNYDYSLCRSLNDAKTCENENRLAVFDRPGFDAYNKENEDYGICTHMFFNSWC